MKNKSLPPYSTLVNLRVALEYELNNVLRFEDRQEVFRIVNYFENRIEEIKEDEAECLKMQIS